MYKHAPWTNRSKPSLAAAIAIEPERASIRSRVYEALLRAGDQGLTHHELIAQLHRAESTVRGRCKELVDLGLARDSGRTRPAPSGLQATVWVVDTPAEQLSLAGMLEESG